MHARRYAGGLVTLGIKNMFLSVVRGVEAAEFVRGTWHTEVITRKKTTWEHNYIHKYNKITGPTETIATVRPYPPEMITGIIYTS